MNKQLAIGTKVEYEHRKTYRFIKNYLKQKNKLPPENLVFRKIASDHLHESKSYYKRLKAAKL